MILLECGVVCGSDSIGWPGCDVATGDVGGESPSVSSNFNLGVLEPDFVCNRVSGLE